jgi:putative nucleotidyltransferase with HDIG domain
MGKVPLERIASEVDDLPALPQITAQVIKLTEDPDSTVQDLGDLICQDQALTTKVLRLANSAYYGFPRRIGTVTQALIILGFNTIRSLVMAASVHNVLAREVAGYALGQGELWRHSIGVAIGARMLSKRTRCSSPEQAFVAGLVHDIGKVILSLYVKDDFEAIMRLVQEGTPFMTAEEQVLGFGHAAVGARVAEKWNLPPALVKAIAGHHTLGRGEPDDLTALVHVADALCLMMGVGLGGDGLLYPLKPEALDKLNLGQADLEAVMSELADSLSDTSMLF